MESRKAKVDGAPRTSGLPVDYLTMVTDVFTTNFDSVIKAISKTAGAGVHFEVNGSVFPDEIVLAVSLIIEGHLAATTVYASIDFDPKASAPTAQDLLAVCVDAAGAVFVKLTEDQKAIEGLIQESLSAMKEIPFDWTPIEVERQRIHVKVDKANPKLDQLADDWLNRHDPEFQERQAKEQAETEKLFFTGPKSGSGSVH